MTLSVLDAHGHRLLTVDMLKHKTMAAGTDGDRLARAYNDLAVLAALPAVLRGEPLPPLPHPEAGLSSGPWAVEFSAARRRLRIRSAQGVVIAERVFPRTTPEDAPVGLVRLLASGGNRTLSVDGASDH
jgi:hypothetical protein